MAKWFKERKGTSTPVGWEEAPSFSSSWLRSAERHPLTGMTNVTFRDGFVWQGQMDVALWDSFKRAGSKGKWWWARMDEGRYSFTSKR